MALKNILLLIFFCFLSATLVAQAKQHDFAENLKKIDSLINKKGLAQSALRETNSVYRLAKKENNGTQVLKALLYRMDLQEKTQEDAFEINVHDLKNEIKTTAGPAASILKSLLAETYWNYFQRNRYKIYDLTNLSNTKSEDPATWTISEFHKNIGSLYSASLANTKQLQQTRLEPFDAIILKGNVRWLRPTLFDLLAHRALEYFKNEERTISEPKKNFEIDAGEAFADKSVFIHYHFKTPDSSSLQFKALQLFQRLLAFHATDVKPDALIDVDINRLEFVHHHNVLDNSDELYQLALQNVTTKYGSLAAAAQAWYLQAVVLSFKAGIYKPLEDTTNRYAFIPSKAICEKVIAEKDSSEGKTNCQNLLNEILSKRIALKTERVNISGQPFRTLVNYRNCNLLYVRILKVDTTSSALPDNYPSGDIDWKKLYHAPVFRSFTRQLPETNDYQEHTVEIKIDALPPGEYTLLASANSDFSMDKNVLVVQYFYVSNIAFINDRDNYFVLNRETGQPLAGASVQLWNQYIEDKTGKYRFKKAGSFQSDVHGYFFLKEMDDSNRTAQMLEIKTESDYLFLKESIQSNAVYSDASDEELGKKDYEKDNLKVFLFTDRSIYRPGQTVFFKGIAVTKDFDSKQSKIIPGFKTKLILYDANQQKIDSLLLASNEFGSYHGKFILPGNLLNGKWKIADESENEQSFAVEEYKRPKFYVEYEKPKGSHRVNDTIRVSGTAKAFSGNVVGEANVKFRVSRLAKFIYPSLFSRRLEPSYYSQEIAHGETTTGADGKFYIDFIAFPDHSISKAFDPVFDYEISTDITDISGETRSASTTVSIGYQSLFIYIDSPVGDDLPVDSLKNIFIRSQNSAGVFEKATVKLSIFSLKSPDRLIHTRFWQQPDQFAMSREEFLKNFPHDEYNDEINKETWEKTAKVYETTVLTREGISTQLVGTTFSPGWYLIEITAKDKYGEEAKNLKYIQLYESNSGKPASPRYTWNLANHPVAEPGSQATVNFGTSANDVFLIQQVERLPAYNRQSKTGYSFFNVPAGKKSFDFSITENDRGGFGVYNVFVKDNRFFISHDVVGVLWTNKELSISYESFREKTLPGSPEKLTLKIKGRRSEKVASEVLTAMYDASLDQFKPQWWDKPNIWDEYVPRVAWTSKVCFNRVHSQYRNTENPLYKYFNKTYDVINSTVNSGIDDRMKVFSYGYVPPGEGGEAAQKLSMMESAVPPQKMNVLSQNIGGSAGAMVVQDVQLEDVREGEKHVQINNASIHIRKNFNETAFFFPDLHTDSMGNISFSFTMPEAVTQWKWMTLAHNKDLAFGYSEKTIVTQKKLMVQPNAPRFLREGDHIDFSTKISNLTDSEITGQVELQILDATTNEPVDGWFQNMQANQYFTVAANQSEVVSFPLQAPFQFNKPIIYRVVARARQKTDSTEVSDGEEAALPVLSNRMLVTESLPLNMQGGGTRNFKFEKLLQSGGSETLNHRSLTFEFTANPAWYAVQALPYLVEFPYECAEQTFNRFYANTLALKIVNSSPLIKQWGDKWKTNDTASLSGNLQKNQELKSVLLQETPWVIEAKTESEQQKQIALLFDSARMAVGLESALSQLIARQSEDGGFSWFSGGPDDRYITQYILSGVGHLKELGALPDGVIEKINKMVASSIAYLDKKISEDYKEIIKRKPGQPTAEISETAIQYLYMRSFFSNYAIPGETFGAVNYFRKQSQLYWLHQNKYLQGMIALSLFRTGDKQRAKEILASLKQNAIVDEETGMHWKDLSGGYYWYQSPVEAQSLLIEAFAAISGDEKTVNALRTWLLKQKQTQHWPTTKATADACYALLLRGSDWLARTPDVQIISADKMISKQPDSQSKAGTGYFKTTIDGPFVKPAMGNISVTISPSPSHKEAPGPAWGAVYWQYFEDLDKITSSATPLRLNKQLFVEKNTDHGPVLEPLPENAVLHIGDKVKVRIELRADRDMEYVHLKDMRASCMEPVDVLSGYKWQGGLGYYETTKDASTNFFFDQVRRGTYVFEYSLFVMAKGSFSNGIATVQCMYAPEFTAHCEGTRVNVEDQQLP